MKWRPKRHAGSHRAGASSTKQCGCGASRLPCRLVVVKMMTMGDTESHSEAETISGAVTVSRCCPTSFATLSAQETL